MSTESTFNQLPGWAKGVIAIAATGVAVFAAYKGYKWWEEMDKRKADAAETTATEVELRKLNKDEKTKQKLTAVQVASMANQLHEAMDGYGTNTSALVKILLQISNQADWLAVNDAYGVRVVSSGKLNPTPDFKGTLQPALVSELGTLDSPVLPQVNQIFAKRGIKAIL